MFDHSDDRTVASGSRNNYSSVHDKKNILFKKVRKDTGKTSNEVSSNYSLNEGQNLVGSEYHQSRANKTNMSAESTHFRVAYEQLEEQEKKRY